MPQRSHAHNHQSLMSLQQQDVASYSRHSVRWCVESCLLVFVVAELKTRGGRRTTTMHYCACVQCKICIVCTRRNVQLAERTHGIKKKKNSHTQTHTCTVYTSRLYVVKRSAHYVDRFGGRSVSLRCRTMANVSNRKDRKPYSPR